MGVDVLAESVAHARQALEQDPLPVAVEFHQSDFYALPFEADTFDTTFCGNCWPYVQEPLKLLAEQKRVTKPGGRVISKEYDGSVLILHPVDALLLSKVLYATERVLEERPPDDPFDNVPGRKVRGMFLQAGFQDVTTKTYAIQKHAPLMPDVKHYLRLAIEWYGVTGAPYLSQAERQQWQSYTDPTAPQYILDRDDLYYCAIDMMTIGTVA